MKYRLNDYDRDAFHRIDDLVRLCHADTRDRLKDPWRGLEAIQTSEEGLTEGNITYIQENSGPGEYLNGVCFHNSPAHLFTVWINPELQPGSLLHELTLIHELCHGYLGPGMHGRLWRRYYGVALVLYNELINPSLQDVDWQIKHTIRRYRSEEDPIEDYSDFVGGCISEQDAIQLRVNRNINRIRHDFERLQEMRKGCHASTSAITPTPAYLASLPKKVGMGFPSK
jgi:hypothetical protein